MLAVSRRDISSPDGVQITVPRILLAEDDPANQRLAILMLQRLGCAVDPAGTGQQALQAARSFAYDLVFLDFQMPEMDGLTAAAEIRKLPVPHSQVPILALTANVFEEDRQRAIAVGMNDFLIKPVTLDSLRTALQRWLPKHLARATQGPESARVRVVAPPAPSPDLQPDLQGLQRRMDEMKDLLDQSAADEILALCKRDWPHLLHTASEQLGAASYGSMRETIHRLAGSALQVGASGLGQLCRGLETLLRGIGTGTPQDSDPPISAAQIQQLQERFQQIQQRVDGLLVQL